jgi:hypothetical protein
MNQPKDTRWQVHELPEPDVQAALGRVTARHGFLDHVLIRTIKTLTGITFQEADVKYARWGSSRLRRLVDELATTRLGKESEAVTQLAAFLAQAKRVSGDRNALVHGIWTRDMDSDETLLIDSGKSSTPPTAEELDKLADQILWIAGAINHARLSGFLHEALQATQSPP